MIRFMLTRVLTRYGFKDLHVFHLIFLYLQMSENETPAHPPVQAMFTPVQPGGVPQQPHPHGHPQYPYGYYHHPAPYGYQVPQHGDGQFHPPTTKRPLDEKGDGPTPTKFGGAGRGRGRAKQPGHLWGWQRIGFFEDKPSPQVQPACHSHQRQGCDECYTFVLIKKKD